jgi:hypothetical protein
MAQQEEQHLGFLGFGARAVPETQEQDGVFILAVYRDGTLSAAAHATERGAMEAAIAYLDEELEEGGEDGTLDDLYARAQGIVADEGGVMEIIPSTIFDRED